MCALQKVKLKILQSNENIQNVCPLIDNCRVSSDCKLPMFEECNKCANCDFKPWVLYAIAGFAVTLALILTMCIWCPCCCIHKCLQKCHICPPNDEEEIEHAFL